MTNLDRLLSELVDAQQRFAAAALALSQCYDQTTLDAFLHRRRAMLAAIEELNREFAAPAVPRDQG